MREKVCYEKVRTVAVVVSRCVHGLLVTGVLQHRAVVVVVAPTVMLAVVVAVSASVRTAVRAPVCVRIVSLGTRRRALLVRAVGVVRLAAARRRRARRWPARRGQDGV